MKEYQYPNYIGYTNIPGNKTSNTLPPTQNQRADSFTESSSTQLDDDIIFIGEKRTHDFSAGNQHKLQKLNDASAVSPTNLPIEPALYTVRQGENSFPQLPKPIILENIINASPLHQDNSQIIVASPLRNGTMVQVTLNSPTKLLSDQKAITQYCKQEADQISKNLHISQVNSQTPFVDPTYDTAFKYLFSKLELATSFIHSLLNLNNTKIISLKPINVHLAELQQGNQCNENQAALAVDGLFKVKTDDPQHAKMIVFLEMQRKNFPGFLMREQIYTALIATNAVKKGVSKDYSKIPKVVGIIIALKSVLHKEVPYCSKISTKVQSKDGHLINIQFSSLTDMRIFELEKFQHHPDSSNVNKNSPNTLQWLNFLLKCGQVKSIPDNSSDIITKAYNHMKRVNMTQENIALIDACQIKAALEEQARNQQLIDAERQGEIKSAIKTIQNLLKVPNINDDVIIQIVSAQLNSDQVTKTLNYIRSQESSGNVEDIMASCNLLGNDHELNEDAFLSGLTNDGAFEQSFN